MSDTFYITTAIDYPNSNPHMGHAYEKVVADFYARAYRLLGRDTRFVIGLDEHGNKILEAAQAAGAEPQAFVDEKAKVFHALYDFLEITRDDFIRTSEPRHHRFAQEIFRRVEANGDIYLGAYQADYCVACERAYTKSELDDGNCPVHGRPTTKVDEPSYFFRLGKYRDALREHIESHPEFVVPEERRNEVLARLRGEVYDLSISRSTFDWGVPLPSDPKHVLYVWFDALSNYISAIREPEELFERYWPADCHVIGKDILWFHTVIWPAMLLAAGIELPAQVYVHGFILDKDGRKMAKTLGNVVDPIEVAEDFGVDVLRYYFLRAFASGQDGRFSVDELEDRYQSELGNELGNLVLRIAKLATTRLGAEVGRSGGAGLETFALESLVEDYKTHVERREHHRALEAVWERVRGINTFLNDRQPWKLSEPSEVLAVIRPALDALRAVVHLLDPVMPSICARIAKSLGFEIGPFETLGATPEMYRVEPSEALFPRREREKPPASGNDAPRSSDKKKKKAESMSSPENEKPKGGGGDVDPFAKVDLRVGRVVEVAPHPDADALWHLMVDLGEDEPRSICAGLREHVSAEELTNRAVLVVANLKPAKLRGVESRGMILATDGPGGKVTPVAVGDGQPGDPVTVEGIEPRPKKKLSSSDFGKAPLVMKGGVVTYAERPLSGPNGVITCDAEDGAEVR